MALSFLTVFYVLCNVPKNSIFTSWLNKAKTLQTDDIRHFFLTEKWQKILCCLIYSEFFSGSQEVCE